MIAYNHTRAAWWTPGESWSLGDSPAVAVVLDESCGSFRMRTARYVNEDTSYGEEIPGRIIRVFDTISSHLVLEDFFAKLELCYG